jgi:hypothetical protein
MRVLVLFWIGQQGGRRGRGQAAATGRMPSGFFFLGGGGGGGGGWWLLLLMWIMGMRMGVLYRCRRRGHGSTCAVVGYMGQDIGEVTTAVVRVPIRTRIR